MECSLIPREQELPGGEAAQGCFPLFCRFHFPLCVSPPIFISVRKEHSTRMTVESRRSALSLPHSPYAYKLLLLGLGWEGDETVIFPTAHENSIRVESGTGLVPPGQRQVPISNRKAPRPCLHHSQLLLKLDLKVSYEKDGLGAPGGVWLVCGCTCECPLLPRSACWP